jgi:hypothetical protein
MNECEKICDILIEYANRNLTKSENSKIILHLSKCEACRKELADILIISKQLSEQMADVPIEVQEFAYQKISKNPNKTLDEIISSKSPFMVFEILNYILEPTKKSIDLALQII